MRASMFTSFIMAFIIAKTHSLHVMSILRTFALWFTAGLTLSTSAAAEPAPVPKVDYESFESAIPNTWRTTGGATFALTTERYKSGEHSLVWSWKSVGDAIEVSGAELFNNESAGKGFAIWFYNETPHAVPMRAELLLRGSVIASVWFWMDFQGWRPLGSSYQDAGLKTGQAIDGIRIHPPDGIAAGRLFLDCASFSQSIRGGALGDQMPWSGVPENLRQKPSELVFSDTDIHLNRPWLPERREPAQITASERDGLAQLAQRLLPPLSGPGKGLKTESIETLRQTMKEYRIKRDEQGRITGRPVDSDSILKPDDAIDFWAYLKFCETVQGAYSQAKEPAQRDELERMFIDLSAHLLDQGWSAGSRLRRGDNYPGASGACFRAMHDVLEKAGLARGIALAMASALGCQNNGGYLWKTPVASMDGLGFWNTELIPFLLLLPDESERLQHVLAAKRFFDLALVNPATLGPDGCAYHHGTFHFAYASYNLPRLVGVLQKLVGTDFRLSKDAHERLRTYAHAIAFTLSGGEQPYNLGARAGTPLHGNMGDLAIALAQLGSPDGSQALDPEMLALAVTEFQDLGKDGAAKLNSEPLKSWLAGGGKPLSLDGHLVMNGSPIGIHRRPGFLVGIAGMSKFWEGLEIYGWTQLNNYGRFARNGSICVVANGSPLSLADSGWAYDGWNWSHFPGTTALLSPDADLFDGYALYRNGSAFAGGTELDGNGVWAMDFSGGNGVRFKKSVFCFDNRITVVTSDIQVTAKTGAPAITTLFQNSIRPGHDSITFDDESTLSLGESKQLGGNRTHWLIDNQGIGYHLPAGQPTLILSCRRQEWTYMIRKYLIDPAKDPFPTINDYHNWNRRGKDMAALAKCYRPSVGEFALGWFDHGAAQSASSCAYTMVINVTPERMRAFAANPTYEILSQNEHVHALRDRPTGTTAYALFTANPAIAAAGLLRANDQPCHIMLRPNGANLKLSLACTDIARTRPVALTLEGAWKPTTPAPQIVRCTSDGKTTVLELQPDYYMPLRMELAPANGG